jgi:short-subunit dehydrogenase
MKRVAITGASKGLGEALAREWVATHGASTGLLVLMGRDEAKLRVLATEFDTKAAKKICEVWVGDLTIDRDRRELVQKLAQQNVDTLILNAGFGYFRSFVDSAIEEQVQTVQGNIIANLEMVHAWLRSHLGSASGSSAALSAGRVDSLSGFQRESRPWNLLIVSSHGYQMRVPHFATYVASKTFLTDWASTLALELKTEGHSATVSIVCPGAMQTEFSTRAKIPKMIATPAASTALAKKILAKVGRPGIHYLTMYDQVIRFLNWFLPRALMDWIVITTQTRALKRSSQK